MTATFSTCHVCQIPVNQCVTESQNDFTNINVENITERDTNSPTRLQIGSDLASDGLDQASTDLGLYWNGGRFV